MHIQIESACMKCTAENVSDQEIKKRFIQELAVINDWQIGVNISCRIHGSKNILFIPHVVND